MKNYLIQRNLPAAGKLSQSEQIAIAQRSVQVIEELGHDNLQWQHSYITEDNLWCVYKAVDEEILREHARRGQFPCDNIREIKGVLSPATALMTA
jgi:hypothetical protein